MPRFDPTFNPEGGAVTDDELRRWDPDESPPAVVRELRKLDLTGNLTRPLIVMHGTADPIVSPGETAGYASLVSRRVGRRDAEEAIVGIRVILGGDGPDADEDQRESAKGFCERPA